MAKEISTRSKAPSAVSTQTSKDEKTAFELQQRGKSFGYIIDHTDYEDAVEVAKAIQAYQVGLASVKNMQWQEGIDMELSRLDALMSEAWDLLDDPPGRYDHNGVFLEVDYMAKLKAIETILKISKQRVELKGWNQVDPTSQEGIVVLVQGHENTKDYVESLEKIVRAQALPASTVPGS